MTRNLTTASALVLLLICASAVEAAERNYWRHSRGHFTNTSGNKWEEKIDDATFHFEEKDRTDAFVLLFDRSRNCHIRLYNDHCDVKFGDGEYKKFYDGRWGK
jgi:hypothetical protein